MDTVVTDYDLYCGANLTAITDTHQAEFPWVDFFRHVAEKNGWSWSQSPKQLLQPIGETEVKVHTPDRIASTYGGGLIDLVQSYVDANSDNMDWVQIEGEEDGFDLDDYDPVLNWGVSVMQEHGF